MATHTNEPPPIKPGETLDTSRFDYKDADTDEALIKQWEGGEWDWPDVDYSATSQGVHVKPRRSQKTVRRRLVRNVSGQALLPKRLVRFQDTADGVGARVDGYAIDTAEEGFPVDEFLPAARGIPDNHLGWIVVKGPAMCLTNAESDNDNNISSGGAVCCQDVGASSGDPAGGRIGINNIYTSDATTNVEMAAIVAAVANNVGFAISSLADADSTDEDVLIEVGRY